MTDNVVYSILSSNVALTALVPATRMTPATRSQGVDLPAVTFSQIAATRMNAMGGNTGLVQATVQVDIWAESRLNSMNIASKLWQAMTAASRTTVAGAWVDAVLLIEERGEYELPSGGEERGTYRVSQDYHLWHRESLS